MAQELEYPWQRDEIRDLIEVVIDTPEARRAYAQGFYEWIEDLNDLTLDGPQCRLRQIAPNDYRSGHRLRILGLQELDAGILR